MRTIVDPAKARARHVHRVRTVGSGYPTAFTEAPRRTAYSEGLVVERKRFAIHLRFIANDIKCSAIGTAAVRRLIPTMSYPMNPATNEQLGRGHRSAADKGRYAVRLSHSVSDEP